MAVKTEPAVFSDGIKWEQQDHYSREKVTVLSGESLSMLEVIGRVNRTVPTTGTADGDNTGNGTMTGVSGSGLSKVGTYTVKCIAAAADGGRFSVTDPDGKALAEALVGEAYTSDELNFTLNDGATDFAVGDEFTVAVTEAAGKVVALDPSAADGSEIAAGIMVAAVDASSADKEGVIINDDALAAMDNLVWPDGITSDQKTAAIAQLAALGIKATSLA